MIKIFQYILYVLCFMIPVLKVHSNSLTNCKAFLKKDTLTLENDLICRKYLWNGGNIITISITDKVSNFKWKLNNNKPDSFFPGEDKPKNGTFETVVVPKTVL